MCASSVVIVYRPSDDRRESVGIHKLKQMFLLYCVNSCRQLGWMKLRTGAFSSTGIVIHDLLTTDTLRRAAIYCECVWYAIMWMEYAHVGPLRTSYGKTVVWRACSMHVQTVLNKCCTDTLVLPVKLCAGKNCCRSKTGPRFNLYAFHQFNAKYSLNPAIVISRYTRCTYFKFRLSSLYPSCIVCL